MILERNLLPECDLGRRRAVPGHKFRGSPLMEPFEHPAEMRGLLEPQGGGHHFDRHPRQQQFRRRRQPGPVQPNLRGAGELPAKDPLQMPGRKPAPAGQLPGLILGLDRQRRPLRGERNFHDFRMCLPY